MSEFQDARIDGYSVSNAYYCTGNSSPNDTCICKTSQSTQVSLNGVPPSPRLEVTERTSLLGRHEQYRREYNNGINWSGLTEKIVFFCFCVVSIIVISWSLYMLWVQHKSPEAHIEFDFIPRGTKRSHIAENGVLSLPVSHILLTQTDSVKCSSSNQCISDIKSLPDSKIPYSFVIENDGTIYEVRGWESKPLGVANEDYNALFIAFIGSSQLLSVSQILSFKALLDYSVMSGYLTICYNIEVRANSSQEFIKMTLELEQINHSKYKCDVYF